MAKATQIIPQSTNTLGTLLYYLGVTQGNLYLQPAWYGHTYQLSEMSAKLFPLFFETILQAVYYISNNL